MQSFWSRQSTGIALIAVLGGGALRASADPPPIEAYAALPAVKDPRLSPDGNSIAMIAPVHGRPALVIRSIDGQKSTLLPTGDTIPEWFQWKTSTRLIASVRYTSTMYAGGDLNFGGSRLIFIDSDGSNPALLKGGNSAQIQDRILSLLPGVPDAILVSLSRYGVARVNVNSGEFIPVHEPIGPAAQWLVDGRGAIRGVEIVDQEGFGRKTRRKFKARASVTGEWQLIDKGDLNKGHRFELVGFEPENPNLLYVLADDEQGLEVARTYDLATQSLGPVLLSGADCKGDISVIMHNYLLIGFWYPCRGGVPILFNSDWRHDWEIVSKALKTSRVTIIDRTADGNRALFSVAQSVASPPSYWLLDRSNGKAELRWVAEAYPNIPDRLVAVIKPVSYQARDGLKIPAFLTMPIGEHTGPIPFVILPHGGPTANDVLEFDWMAQFFASRGYGVLQPQFRGSTGYGTAFQEAGYHQWGGKMQDDLTDGTRWLIDQNYADPARICIVGASYGGYAALMGVVKEPGLYACAAAFAPVTDIGLYISNSQHFAFSDINTPRVRNASGSDDAISPAENADKIRVPVLLMHGRDDFTVQPEHTERMERALRRAGKQVEAIYLDGADHFFGRSSDRLAWLTAVDKLLASTIGAARPTPSSQLSPPAGEKESKLPLPTAAGEGGS